MARSALRGPTMVTRDDVSYVACKGAKTMAQPQAEPTGASAIAPDTSGRNFYDDDLSLRHLLDLYLSPELVAHLAPHLSALGWLAANELDQWAHDADRHPPVLHHRDRYGRDRQWIEYHPSYREMEKVAYGRFGLHAMSHRPGVLGWHRPFPAAAKHAFTYLFNQAEFGLGCPINVTDSGAMLVRRYGDDDLKARFLERMTSTDMDRLWQGAQFMTEKEGGSDVGRDTTTAVRDGDAWRIHGDKWFCSNADARVAMLLARPEGAGPGTRGLGLFVMPRFLDDGTPNAYRIARLKDKLGTRSMASGEIVLEGALAWQVGQLDRGFVQMAEMVNWSRLSNGVKSTALMRRGLHDALQVSRHRIAFGKVLNRLPLARRQLLKLMLPVEQALSLCFFTADCLDRAEGHDGQPASQEVQAALRLATPVLKFRATRDGRRVTGDAMDVRGGTGYVEEWVNPRLLRDAHLGSIWEGTGNIVGLDAIQRAVGRHNAHEAFAASLHRKLDDAAGAPAAFVDKVRALLDRAVAFAGETAKHPENEALCRQATSALYHAASAACLTWEGAALHALHGDARRLLYAGMAVEHRLTPRDVFTTADTAKEDRLADLLLSDAPVPMAAAAALL
jgi:alkylation response protein AidB-like acyl-CoA dehydrogenase